MPFVTHANFYAGFEQVVGCPDRGHVPPEMPHPSIFAWHSSQPQPPVSVTASSTTCLKSRVPRTGAACLWPERPERQQHTLRVWPCRRARYRHLCIAISYSRRGAVNPFKRCTYAFLTFSNSPRGLEAQYRPSCASLMGYISGGTPETHSDVSIA